jgi:hypothetical protein
MMGKSKKEDLDRGGAEKSFSNAKSEEKEKARKKEKLLLGNEW